MTEALDELRRFFSESVGGSLEQLRIALLLRSAPERDWDPSAVAAELRMAPASAGMRLYLLSATGIAAGEGSPVRYRYAPRGQADAMLALIHELYVKGPGSLAALAGGRDPLQSVAEAFVLRKKDG